MAKRLKSFTFTGRGRRYPWSDWMDGSIWQARTGKDFTGDAEQFRGYLHSKATDSGLKVRTSVNKKTGTVVFQFHGWDDQQD